MSHVTSTRSAVLDEQHLGDIRGALGTIPLNDTGPRSGVSAKLKTLLAIVGPGLIVMVGDNDAGAFATYGQAGQNYGTKLLWTLLLLVPVLYVNQEMVLRLGAVTGVGHARLILERFGKFWGAFSVIGLFILNALTLVTEFIGITLAASYLGLPKVAAVVLAAVVITGSAFTGSFRRFERAPAGLPPERDGDAAEPQGVQHARQHAAGVLLRLGQQRAAAGRGLDLLLRQDVDLLLAVRVAGEEVPDPVQQALLLGVHVGLPDVEHGGLQPGVRERHGRRGPVRRHPDRLAVQPGEVNEGDVGALADEQGVAALDEGRQERRLPGQVHDHLE